MELTPVYDYNVGANTMWSSTPLGSATTRAANSAQLSVSPVTNVNATQEADSGTVVGLTTTHNGVGYFGIILGNMFKFVDSANGTKTAIEIAGNGNVGGGVYVNNYNGTADTSATESNRTLYKGQAYLANVAMTAGGGNPATTSTIRLDDATKIIVRTQGTNTLTVYDGCKDLPGNIIVEASSEVDWADPDGDGRAEYIYVTGRVDGNITYGLFYTNGGAAQWNGVEGNGSIAGYLNGEATTLTFDNEIEYRLVLNSRGTYNARIFGVQMTNGIVTNLMGHSAPGLTPTQSERFVNAVATDRRLGWGDGIGTKNGLWLGIPTNGVGVTVGGTKNATTMFNYGATYGNTYNENTHVVYFRDLNDTTVSDLSYDFTTDSITISGSDNTGWTSVRGTRLLLTGATKRIGDALNYLNDPARRTDVTVVFDEVSGGTNDKVILEVYVATDPDVTPGDDTVYYPPITPNLTIGEIMGQNNGYFELTLTSTTALTFGSIYDKVNITVENLSDTTQPVSNFSFNSADSTGTASTLNLSANVTKTIRLSGANMASGMNTYRVTITYSNSGTAVAYGQQTVTVVG